MFIFIHLGSNLEGFTLLFFYHIFYFVLPSTSVKKDIFNKHKWFKVTDKYFLQISMKYKVWKTHPQVLL